MKKSVIKMDTFLGLRLRVNISKVKTKIIRFASFSRGKNIESVWVDLFIYFWTVLFSQCVIFGFLFPSIQIVGNMKFIKKRQLTIELLFLYFSKLKNALLRNLTVLNVAIHIHSVEGSVKNLQQNLFVFCD